MPRSRESSERFSIDILLVAAGTLLGVVAGYVVGGTVGRVTAHRVKRALKRRRRRRGRLRPDDWSDDLTDALEARAMDAIRENPVLARRAIRARVLGPGIVELEGAVESPAERLRAGQLVRRLGGVTDVVNRLLVTGIDIPAPVVSDPDSPRAARG